MPACGKCSATTASESKVAPLLQCARCKKQWYCSKACQRMDWPEHKASCFTSKERKMQRQVVRDTAVKECHSCKKTEKAEGVALSMCSRCRAVRYCSPQCIRADWATHKQVCIRREGKKAPLLANPVQEQCQLQTVIADRCRRAGDRCGEGQAYCILGIAYRSLGQVKKAIKYHNKRFCDCKGGGRQGWGRHSVYQLGCCVLFP